MLEGLGVREVVRRIRDRETSSEEVVRACLARIREREPVVQAWTHIDPAAAIEAARKADAEPAQSPLHGLPVGIKDIMDTVGMPTGYGSPIYDGYRPPSDAACVAALRAAGALVLGKTVTTEFATTHPGKTRHPLDPARTPGGSSSGSAAAVADRMVPVALGTQTMGSVIRPAAYCGIVGYKPSYGLINRAGIKPQAESIDTVGVMARDVDDTALVSTILCGAPPDAFDGIPERAPRILLNGGRHWTGLEESACEALDAAARCLADAGAIVKDAGDPPILAAALDAHLKIVCFELARGYVHEWRFHRDRLTDTFAALYEAGLKVSFDSYVAAQEIASEARRWVAGTFETADLWLTVSAPGEAPLGMSTGDTSFNRLWSVLHLPAMSLPFGIGRNGLPVGVQIVGRFRQDAAFFRNARWVEKQLGRL